MENTMKKEATLRIKMLENLGVDEAIVDAWEMGKSCYSKSALLEFSNSKELVGVNYTFNESEQLKQIKEDFENALGCLVYYGIYSKGKYGEMLSLLYVSPHENEWLSDRADLMNGFPTAYCYHINLQIGEIGTIGIKLANGGFIRVK